MKALTEIQGFGGASQKSSVAKGNTDLVLGGYPENT